jgi:hypothetical protein
MDKIYHDNSNQMKSGTRELAVLYATSLESYQEKRHSVITQWSVRQLMTILNTYASDNRFWNYVRKTLLEGQEKDESTSTTGDFNNPLSK